jgi:hydroxypyruvate isomerase
MGYSAVEMVDAARRAAARAAGLEILNISGLGKTEGLNRKEHHKELVPKIKACLEEAAGSGVGAVIAFSGSRKGQPDCEGLRNCRAALEEILPLAEAKSVEIHFEGLNIYDHEDYQADSPRYMFSLARALKSPSFKILFDIYHMEMMGEDCSGVLGSAANIPMVGHLHIAEAKTRTMPVARGAIDYARIVKAAVKAGYSRYWGMEFIPKGDVMAELAASKKLFESFI